MIKKGTEKLWTEKWFPTNTPRIFYVETTWKRISTWNTRRVFVGFMLRDEYQIVVFGYLTCPRKKKKKKKIKYDGFKNVKNISSSKFGQIQVASKDYHKQMHITYTLPVDASKALLSDKVSCNNRKD